MVPLETTDVLYKKSLKLFLPERIHRSLCFETPCTAGITLYWKFFFVIEGFRERTEHLDIFLFLRPSLNGVLFPMFCLLVEEEY